MDTIWSGDFHCLEDLQQWEGAFDDLSADGVEVIYADYETYPYEGSAFVIWRNDGKLYEAHCSHCSCNGLDVWSPEETSIDALLKQQRVQQSPALVARLEALR